MCELMDNAMPRMQMQNMTLEMAQRAELLHIAMKEIGGEPERRAVCSAIVNVVEMKRLNTLWEEMGVHTQACCLADMQLADPILSQMLACAGQLKSDCAEIKTQSWTALLAEAAVWPQTLVTDIGETKLEIAFDQLETEAFFLGCGRKGGAERESWLVGLPDDATFSDLGALIHCVCCAP